MKAVYLYHKTYNHSKGQAKQGVKIMQPTPKGHEARFTAGFFWPKITVPCLPTLFYYTFKSEKIHV